MIYINFNNILLCGDTFRDHAMQTFVMNFRCPNLNGTKYLTKRVHSTLPTDLEAVASMSHLQKQLSSLVMNATILWQLSFQDVEKLWEKLIVRNLVKKDEANDIVYNMLHLSDRCWLTIDKVTNSCPDFIYPFSMLHVVKERIRNEMLPTHWQNCRRNQGSGVIGAATIASDPKVVAVAVPLLIVSAFTCVVM